MSIELIAECSSNHGGDLELAKAFVWSCAEAGADWVKFQSYQVATLRPGDPQREWLAQAELSDDAHYILKAECEQANVKFLTTVFHASRVPFLASLGLDAIKVGSGEAAEMSVVEAVHGAFPRVFVSMGLRNDHEIDRAWRGGSHGVRFFHCLSRYPHPSLYAHASYGGTTIGYSDHSRGLYGCQIALIDGAQIIEKHVCHLDQKRPRQLWEATMADLKELRSFADDDPQKYVGRWQHTPTP